MYLRIGWIACLAFCSILKLSAQDGDSTAPKEKMPLKLYSFADPHNPTKAAIYSAVIPGLGQVYNRKYLKLPIVYAGLGGTGYLIYHFAQIVKDSNASFRAQYAAGRSPGQFAIQDRDQARKTRDFAIVAFSAIYVLQIIDATVDAHFYHVNIDQRLDARFYAKPSQLVSLSYHF